ncbi:MAG: hypothetical protein Q7T74_03745, partial [Candidatus Saccharibacteria bacterium]|nr:hypothetical protein [Candidatus Saccharibacteria bacterium]
DGITRANLTEFYQAGDIVKIIDSILRGVDVVEDILGISDILADEILIQSPLLNIGVGQNIELQNYQLVKLALGTSLNRYPKNHTWIIGKLSNSIDVTYVPDLVKVSAIIHDIEWVDPREISFPVIIKEGFPFREEVEQVIHGMDLHFLNVDLTHQCMTDLISFALLQDQYTGTYQSKIDWSIGPEFNNSVLELHLHKNPTVLKSLLQACVSVICEISMEKTHALRKGAGPNAEQIKRDRASAWRRDVDYEFHLHYWSRGNKCIFASCVTHNNFSIPDPD